MKLGQILWHQQITAAVLENGHARPIQGHTVTQLVHRSETEQIPLAELAGKLAGEPQKYDRLRIPINPVEVWASGCTYQQSAAFRDAEHGTREGFYAHVYNKDHRPEIFFKGTSRVCVGPGEPIGLRPDSKFTAPEPELAVVLGENGKIVAFTLANDVSAWDLERENPLYLPQSKTFTACCSLGPYLITADEVRDPYGLQMTCSIERGAVTVFRGEVSTGRLNRPIEKIIEALLLANPVPSGSVLMTGTGIIVTEESALQPGDEVRISVPEFGTLANTAQQV